jgi:sugar phosphate permease
VASAALCFAGSWAWLPPGAPLALALVSLALFAHQAWSTNIHTAITEISPPAHVSVLYGITGAAGTLMGAVVQSAVGPVVDRVGYDPAFVGAGSLYVLAVALLAAAGRIERIGAASPCLRPGANT